MTALASPHSRTASQAQLSTENQDENVMSINANARIDYILKFSRHTVVVIDDMQQGLGAIAGTFLSSLPDNANAALVTVSGRLNDVQVRARINEQLQPGQPFDPEIGLTHSVIEYYNTQSSPISIVIEQAHHLSLQIVHELTLLSALAKKSGREIQVVLLGDVNLGRLVVDNYSLFAKKLSMISAQSGQLLTINSPVFKVKRHFLAFTPLHKVVLSLILTFGFILIGLYAVYQRDSLEFLPSIAASGSDVPNIATDGVLNESSNVGNHVLADLTDKQSYDSSMTNQNGNNEVANASEILSAINGIAPATLELPKEKAIPADILAAINLSETSETNKPTRLEKKEPNKIDAAITSSLDEMQNKKNSSTMVSTAISSHRLIDKLSNSSNGVVIQFAALELTNETSSFELVERFVTQFGVTEYNFYERQMNGRSFVVITSQIFAEREDAANAMLALPTQLQNSGIWLKSVSTIQKEIELISGN